MKQSPRAESSSAQQPVVNKKTVRVKSSAKASTSSSAKAPASSVSIPAGMPTVTGTRYEGGGILRFTMQNTDVSLANALRRTMIGNIPVLAMVGFPDSNSTIHISKNTTQLNNEILKSRIQCIPVHMNEVAEDVDALQVRVSVVNNTPHMFYVTTEHFRIYHKGTRSYLPDSVARKMFPKNDKTDMFIDLVRVHPSAAANVMQTNADTSSRSPGEELEFTADIRYATANEDSAFNAVSKCAYSYTPDESRLRAAWALQEKTYASKEDAARERPDWTILNRQRYYVPNSFDFVIESVGTYTNEEVVVRACDILLEMIKETIKHIAAFDANRSVRSSDRISENCYDISFPDRYTIGKLLDKELFRLYFSEDPALKSPLVFCAFVKDHPQSPTSILRLAFDEAKEPTYILECFVTAAESCAKRITKVKSLFTVNK